MPTLIVSTDPAHSLGDALDQPVGGGMPVYVNGCENLSAMEVRAVILFRLQQHCLYIINSPQPYVSRYYPCLD